MPNSRGLKRLYDSFFCSRTIYLREEETLAIKSFLHSKRPVLHICGNPGTGKTHVTVNTIEGSFLYLNYYSESDIFSKIKNSNSPVVVIDEFDKYYNERRNECMQAMHYLRSRQKLITISNDLRMSGDVLFFRPYSSSDMEKILAQKTLKESAEAILSPIAIKIVSKRIGPSGDLRQLFRYVQEIVGRKIMEGGSLEIDLEDIPLEKENLDSKPNNVHHSIITSLISKNKKASRMEIYSKYLRECQEMKISSHDRTDFNIIYDIYT
ncbi:uncharacterized protein Eint_090210 [Encephalitozoon intestinalis ATCC 50506]|uniref:Cdc6/ORC1-like ATPase lid domain-containing protein n=1 Tax=Encephalitozoon intestinalis (strain ATCC 50506) TaxID=876142 RepID=E0S958_ENCIT|nr:uncharacterized protein Eint_090210 [Encephalitozoon intestinalis ATCC 50506]ADM12151.1 hypothetical protein Eint_090210 [Encephalitozoon intestinalis ATCC 50506]UTX45952.1 cell division control protein 6 [Encephalitozoon intestinalis]